MRYLLCNDVTLVTLALQRLYVLLQLKKGGVAKAKGEGEKEKECTTECKSRRRRNEKALAVIYYS